MGYCYIQGIWSFLRDAGWLICFTHTPLSGTVRTSELFAVVFSGVCDINVKRDLWCVGKVNIYIMHIHTCCVTPALEIMKCHEREGSWGVHQRSSFLWNEKVGEPLKEFCD